MARDPAKPRLWEALMPAVAMSVGWGIRGVFGHERGALVPGALAGLSLALLGGAGLRARTGWLLAAGAAGMALGGVETYGQTVWLTEGPTRADTYWWGMLGLAVKGGVWMGLGGLLMGMAAGRRRHTLPEVAGLLVGLAGLGVLGMQLLNRPFAPPGTLPPIYFSNYVSPADPANTPRPECWGGLWLAMLGLAAWLGLRKRDGFALRLGLGGLIGGAVGFPAAQALNAWQMTGHPLPPGLAPYVDWWKVVEMSFGFLGGLGIGLAAVTARGKEEAEHISPPAAWPATALSAALVTPVVLGDWGMLPPVVESLPLGLFLLPALLAWLGPAGWVGAITLPFLLNGRDLCWDQFAQRAGLLGPAGSLAAWLLGCGAAAGLAIRWARREAETPGRGAGQALAMLAWSFTALTAVKMAVEVGPCQGSPDLPTRLRGPIGVTAALAVGAGVLTWWASRRRQD